MSAEETKTLKLGEWNGALVLIDAKGHRKTIINTIPFVITDEVVENSYQTIDLTIPETAGVDVTLKVGTASVMSINGMRGDVTLTAQDVGALPDTTIIPDISGLATKQELTNGLATKQAKGDYALVSDIPTLVSELQNDSNFATQTQVMQAIAAIPQFALSIVNELPATGAKMVLYLVPKEGTEKDIYNEYIWIEQTSSFEFIGTTAVDLTDYVKNTDYASSTKAGVVKVISGYGIGMGSQEQLHTVKASDSDIKTKTNTYKAIVPSNLDYAVKTGITSNANTLTDAEKTTAQTWLGLDDVVRNTDYATNSTAGIVQVSGGLKMMERYITIQKAENEAIDLKADNYCPIVPSNLNYAVNSVLPTMTQAEYDTLETKDENIFYMIVEE